MEQNSVLTVRFASKEDVEKILEISEGIYDGEDYIPIVLHDWLNDKRRLIFLAEYEGNVIGMSIATISENHQSFVVHSLRIIPRYRRKKLGSMFTKAGVDKVRTMYPHVEKWFVMCRKNFPAYVMFLNMGYTQVMEQTFHFVKKIAWDNIQLTRAECSGSELVSLDIKGVVHLYKSKKLLDLVGLHGFTFIDKGVPYQLPQDAHLLANEVDQVFVDVPVHKIHQQDGFPRSFSHGSLSKRVGKNIWMCHIFTDDPEVFKKHVLCQLNAAARSTSWEHKDLDISFHQSSSSKFDGSKVIKDQLSRLKLNGDVTSNDVVVLQHSV